MGAIVSKIFAFRWNLFDLSMNIGMQLTHIHITKDRSQLVPTRYISLEIDRFLANFMYKLWLPPLQEELLTQGP